jgi:hypothetical protein
MSKYICSKVDYGRLSARDISYRYTLELYQVCRCSSLSGKNGGSYPMPDYQPIEHEGEMAVGQRELTKKENGCSLAEERSRSECKGNLEIVGYLSQHLLQVYEEIRINSFGLGFKHQL